MATQDTDDPDVQAPDDPTGHETDKAELEARDRPQPNLVTRHANLRADEEEPDARDPRAALVDRIEDERQAAEGR